MLRDVIEQRLLVGEALVTAAIYFIIRLQWQMDRVTNALYEKEICVRLLPYNSLGEISVVEFDRGIFWQNVIYSGVRKVCNSVVENNASPRHLHQYVCYISIKSWKRSFNRRFF